MDLEGLIKEVKRLQAMDSLSSLRARRLEGIKQATETFDSLQISMALTKEERTHVMKLKELLGLN